MQPKKRKLSKTQRREEVIKNISNTIFKETQKIGGGNQDLIDKLTEKLETAQSK